MRISWAATWFYWHWRMKGPAILYLPRASKSLETPPPRSLRTGKRSWEDLYLDLPVISRTLQELLYLERDADLYSLTTLVCAWLSPWDNESWGNEDRKRGRGRNTVEHKITWCTRRSRIWNMNMKVEYEKNRKRIDDRQGFFSLFFQSFSFASSSISLILHFFFALFVYIQAHKVYKQIQTKHTVGIINPHNKQSSKPQVRFSKMLRCKKKVVTEVTVW